MRPNNQPDNDVKIDVIQGGLRNDSSVGNLTPIAHETTEATGLKHLDGTLSMARSEPGSASSEFFICIGDKPNWISTASATRTDRASPHSAG